MVSKPNRKFVDAIRQAVSAKSVLHFSLFLDASLMVEVQYRVVLRACTFSADGGEFHVVHPAGMPNGIASMSQ
jgi:hypothetical protein